MVWYEDLNLVIWALLNIIIGVVGIVRKGIIWPLVGFFLLFVGYNYFSQNYDVLAATVFFLLFHVASFIAAIKANI